MTTIERPVSAPVGETAIDTERWVMGGCLLLGALLVVRLVALAANRTDLFFDEAQYWTWSLEPAFGYYSKPPLIGWIIAAATSMCGQGEACIRLPAPLFHTATALAVMWLGYRLYGAQTGVLAGVAFALLPGVSFSSGIISTDVPLLTCWALALVGFAALFETKAWWPSVLLGGAFGVGLNAKYAMAWFVLCAAIYLFATPSRRSVVRDARLWVALAIGVLLIVPNVVWNQAHQFATLSHTADNAKWEGSLIHPGKAVEFFVSQFGVFGPLYFGGLLAIIWRWRRTSWPQADRLLVAFCLPLVAIITMQALVSRAHPNWAAAAYVSGVVLVVATLVREASWGWLKASYAIHGVIMSAIVLATSTAGVARWPVKPDPLARTLGWRAIADETRLQLDDARRAGKPFAAVLTQDRSVTAELLYYLRHDPTPVRAWQAGARPHDHFELTRRYVAKAGDRVLLVTLKDDDKRASSAGPLAAFANKEIVASRDVPAGASQVRHVTFLALSGTATP